MYDEDDVVSITNSLIFNAQYSFSIFILCVLYFLIKYLVNMKTQSHCKTKMTKFSSTNQIKWPLLGSLKTWQTSGGEGRENFIKSQAREKPNIQKR